MKNSRVWRTWTTPSHELKALDGMNNSGLWLTWRTLGCELRSPNTMKSSWWWLTWTTLGHKLKSLDAMNNWEFSMILTTRDLMSLGLQILWKAHGGGWHERLRVMDDINDSKSYKLKPVDAMNSSRLTMIRMIHGHEPMSLNDMNSSGLWMTWITPSSDHYMLSTTQGYHWH